MTYQTIQIKQINTKDVLPIRHKVMWPNMPMNYVSLKNDKDARHFGLFINGELISVISLFVKNEEAQFRKFATLKQFQGFGYGSILLKHIITLVKKERLKKLWCNARVEKSKFYTKFNLKLTDKRFVKGEIDYVVMETNFQE
ncbi:GNAT family N-acetyltransferase [Tenacibaculum aiptasiae]|uniref:GNAT family N-acetyltransferase n=1 Tax=Tenacibaculum aiptasiae TaxID=426481 RepID=UPI0023312D58|nr:GNAT family N-acetyltransferase [Tenacibaculum aiptasiae]